MATPGDEYGEIFGARVARTAAGALAPRRLELASRFGPVAVDLWPAATNVGGVYVAEAVGHGLGRDDGWHPAMAPTAPLAGLADPLGAGIDAGRGAPRLPRLTSRPAGVVSLPDGAADWHDGLLAPGAAGRRERCAVCRNESVARGVAFAAGATLAGVPALSRAATFCLRCYWVGLRPLGAENPPAAFVGLGPAACVRRLDLAGFADADPAAGADERDRGGKAAARDKKGAGGKREKTGAEKAARDWRQDVAIFLDDAGTAALVAGSDDVLAAAPASLGDRLAGLAIYRCPL